MSTFKVGDRVRVVRLLYVDTRPNNPIKVGDEFTVVYISPSVLGWLLVTSKDKLPYTYTEDGHTGYPMRDYQLELVKEDKMQEEKDVRKFKVGDKVRLLRGGGDYPLNRFVDGKVYEISKSSEEFQHPDNPDWQIIRTDGHTGYVNSPDIELVKKDKPKTELRIVYKVMQYPGNSGVYESWSGISDITLSYKINVKTKSPKGWNPLFTFDTFENARASSSNLNPILKCVAKVRVYDQDFSFMGGNPPEGTLLCDWVFPIEEVK